MEMFIDYDSYEFQPMPNMDISSASFENLFDDKGDMMNIIIQ